MGGLYSTEAILRVYRDGDEHGWTTEFVYLWQEQTDQMLDLLESVAREGIREPILLGDDGRVWDGHHRLAVACALRIQYVPVKHVLDSE